MRDLRDLHWHSLLPSIPAAIPLGRGATLRKSQLTANYRTSVNRLFATWRYARRSLIGLYGSTGKGTAVAGRTSDRTVEEAVAYAVGHRIRVELLAALNERGYSAAELREIVRQPLSTVTHHIEALLADGSIEVAETRRIRNLESNVYRAIQQPYYSDEEIAAMGPEQRQTTIAPALQAIMAESLAAFWSGKMLEDQRLWLAWRWFNVDEQGRNEIADEQAASWERIRQIEVNAADRMLSTGETATSIIVSSQSFERARAVPHPPATFGDSPT